MNLKNKIVAVSLSVFASISFTACGGDDHGSFKNSEELIPITTNCAANPTALDISGYITLYSGDVIVKDSNGSQISIYHDSNGVKKVCIVTPSAHIIRK